MPFLAKFRSHFFWLNVRIIGYSSFRSFYCHVSVISYFSVHSSFFLHHFCCCLYVLCSVVLVPFLAKFRSHFFWLNVRIIGYSSFRSFYCHFSGISCFSVHSSFFLHHFCCCLYVLCSVVLVPFLAKFKSHFYWLNVRIIGYSSFRSFYCHVSVISSVVLAFVLVSFYIIYVVVYTFFAVLF